MNKFNHLNLHSIKGFPLHVNHVFNKNKISDCGDQITRNRNFRLQSIIPTITYNLTNLTQNLVNAFNKTWCFNSAFGVIEDNKRFKFVPLVLIPPQPDPNDRRP